MSAVSESLAAFAQGVNADYRQSQEQPLEPPAGLPERSLIWLALAPVWTPRLGAACGFPTEADTVDRAALRWLERQAARPDRADPALLRVAQHALGLLALGGGRLRQAADLFSMALKGFHEAGDTAGAVAAEYHLGDIATAQSDATGARIWLTEARNDGTGWADDVCLALIQRKLAAVPDPDPSAKLAASLSRLGAIMLPAQFGPSALEATRVFDRFARSGLCSATLGAAAETENEVDDRLTEHRYWMTDLLRQQVIDQVTRDPSKGIATIQLELQVIGSRAVAAAESGVPVLRSTLQWARLATLALDVNAMADLLRRECDRALGQTSSVEVNPSGTALAWIQAAEPLEELLKGELTVALDRARRQLDLFHRRRDDDQRYLRNFRECADQLKAIRDLLDDQHAWALHFAGAGGTGKTMLMRYISSVLGPRLGASTARIDFDYLSPDYPAERPGLLLAELAEELRLNAEGPAISLFARFDEELVKLQEQRTGSVAASADHVVRAFASALAALPAPVILLIDTCEELAKLRPDGTSPAGVTKTFDILLELRRTVPGIKVIFAGRRPLASVGDCWQVRGESELPPRPYLRLSEVRGFTPDEALAYLESERVPSHLRPAMLDQARSRSDIDQYIWADQDQAPAKTERYNPFELSGWAALARHREGESLTAADIAATDADRYIELRIIRRIRYEPLKRALPAIGLLGRCDPALLRAALPDLPDFEKMFAELRRQEWITRRGIDFYEVDSGLRRRLLAHYERSAPAEVTLCYQRLAKHLELRTIDDPLDELLPFHFDTAMRVLAREPGRAARWWAEAEERFTAEGQFDWARQLCEFMLGPEGACAELDVFADRPPEVTALRAGVLATQMACFTHTRPQADRRQGWHEAGELLPGYPDTDLAEQLGIRVAAGLVAAAPPGSPVPSEIDRLAGFTGLTSGPLSPQLTASLIAALESLVERAEQERVVQDEAGPEAEPGPWLTAALTIDPEVVYVPWLGFRDPPQALLVEDLEYFAHCLGGRLALLHRQFDTAERLLRLSAGLRPSRDVAGPGHWLDWRPPDDLAARMAIEFARGTYPAILGAKEVLDFLSPGQSEPPATIDAERLQSALLTIAAARTPAEPEQVLGYEVRAQFGRTPDLRPERNAHRAFPALSTALAELAAARGDVDAALELLRTLSRGWLRSGQEFDSVIAAIRALLRIVRRMRLQDEGMLTDSDLAPAPSGLAEAELLWSLDGLDGAKTAPQQPARIGPPALPGVDPDAWLHARWRTLSTLTWSMDAIAEFAAEFGLDNIWSILSDTHSADSFAKCSVFLDAFEYSILGANAESTPIDISKSFLSGWRQKYPDQPEQALRLLLRVPALRRSGPRQATVPDDLIQRLGRRRAALIALDEGEMLALRLPERATKMVDLAAEWFGECDDHAGAVIARTLSALLSARAGARASPELITAISADLRRLPFLPSMDSLSAIAAAPDDAAIGRLMPHSWRPWLVRLVSYLAWEDSSRRQATRLRRIQDWIEGHYGQRRQPYSPGLAAVAVPAELDGWLHKQARDQRELTLLRGLTEPTTLLRQILELRRNGRPYLKRAIEMLAALFIFLACLAGAAEFVDAKAAWFLPPATLIGITMLAVIGRRTWFTINRRLEDRSATPILGTVTITADREPTAESGQARVALSAAGPLADATIDVPAPDGPYDQLASVLPEVLAAELRRLGAAADRYHLLAVQLPPRLAGVCWEALFGPPLRIVRTVPSRRARPTTSWRELRSAISIVTDTAQHATAARGWQPLTRYRRYQYTSRRSSQVYNDAIPGEEIDIVHIVATPIDTASGPRLVLGRVAGDQLRRSGGGRGELMQAADVLARFPDVAFCVLQATPQEHLSRTEFERQQAAMLRLIAAELFSLGVPVVVTIPPLPSSATGVVLRALSEAVASRPRRFVGALSSALKQAAAELTRTPGLSAECALDLCLYAEQGNAPSARTTKGSTS